MMRRYHLQIDDGSNVEIDDEGQDFPTDDFAFASAAVMAGRLLAEDRDIGDRKIEVRVETDRHHHLGTITATMRRAA